MSYSQIVTSNYVSIMNLDTGEVTKFMKDNPLFKQALAYLIAGNFEAAEQLSVKKAVENFASTDGDFSVNVFGGVVKYRFKNGESKELHNTMTERILDMIGDGFDARPLVKFMENLLSNPSKTAIDELYSFLEATGLPITSDGHFIAYKMVNNDYTSIYDNKFKNDVGTVVEMPRNEVCDKRELTCSKGLHFCSKEYLPAYGTGSGTRLLLVKINPADVVSIPSDYNNAKGRASKYLIWKDITEDGWREKYGMNDYNKTSVEEGDWDDEEEVDDWDDEEEVDDWDEDDSVVTISEKNSSNHVSRIVCDIVRGFYGGRFPSMNMSFREMGFDELDIVEMITMVEEELRLEEMEVGDVNQILDLSVNQFISRIVYETTHRTTHLFEVECQNCGSLNVTKRGFNHRGDKQRYKCKDCGNNFYEELD